MAAPRFIPSRAVVPCFTRLGVRQSVGWRCPRRKATMCHRGDASAAKKLAGGKSVELEAAAAPSPVHCPQAKGPTPTLVRRFGSLLDYGSDQVAIGGHRGMGANPWSAARTHGRGRFRENTIRSFQEAVRNGATFVEFDAQTTKDGVVVIWHDNYIVYGDPSDPTSSLISELTYEEFCQLAPINDYSGAAYVQIAPAPGAAATGATSAAGTARAPGGSQRSSSTLSSGDTSSSESLASLASVGSSRSAGSARRRRLLRKLHNASPAAPGEPSLAEWAVHEDDHFPTLDQVFAALPAEVAFDIEVKMTTPNDLPATPAEEVARQLDAILAAVDRGLAAAPRRRLLFSSFDPEVCVELRRRRPEFAVMFLSGGGAYAHADPRRTSVPAAIEFAAGVGLQGIILETDTLRRQPEQIGEARARGLQLMTYGLGNDDPEWVRKQFYLGVHGVIVDDVEGVASSLAAALG